MLLNTVLPTSSAPRALCFFLGILYRILAIKLFLSATQDLQTQAQAKDNNSPSLDCRCWNPGSQEKVGLQPRTSLIMRFFDYQLNLSLHQASVLFHRFTVPLIFLEFVVSSLHPLGSITLFISVTPSGTQEKCKLARGLTESVLIFRGPMIPPSYFHSSLHKYRV